MYLKKSDLETLARLTKDWDGAYVSYSEIPSEGSKDLRLVFYESRDKEFAGNGVYFLETVKEECTSRKE